MPETSFSKKRGERIAVIPSRYGSERFPGKPLAQIGGRPMIEWVWRRASAADLIDRVLVATDDKRIAETVHAFGGEVVMTSPEHTTGTDRIAEAIRELDADIVVNVQGDEPLIPADVINELVRCMETSAADMATAAVPFADETQIENPNNVKVVCAADGAALYFSRAPIPYPRASDSKVAPLHHWGLYAYTRSCLERLTRQPPSPLECCERLEQLRALENGLRIQVLVVDQAAPDVNVPEDIARVEAILKERGDC